MRYAPIAPVSAAALIPDTGYDFCFAEYALRYPEYAEVYRRKAAAGNFVIMDTLRYEDEPLMDLEDLRVAVRAVRPSAVIPPDVLGDLDGTLDLLDTYAPLADLTSTMPVAQAQSVEGFIWAATVISERSGYLALPGPVLKRLGISRPSLLMTLCERLPKMPLIHLLGMPDISELREVRNNQYVMGIDSAKAVSLGLKGLRWNPKTTEEELHRHHNFFEITRSYVQLCSTDIQYNIAFVNMHLERKNDGFTYDI